MHLSNIPTTPFTWHYSLNVNEEKVCGVGCGVSLQKNKSVVQTSKSHPQLPAEGFGKYGLSHNALVLETSATKLIDFAAYFQDGPKALGAFIWIAAWRVLTMAISRLRGSSLFWRLWIELELRVHALDKAKALLYRAISHCAPDKGRNARHPRPASLNYTTRPLLATIWSPSKPIPRAGVDEVNGLDG